MKNLMLFSFFSFFSLFAEEEATVQTQTILAEKADISCIWESFGHIINKYLVYINVPFDTTQIIQGIQDALLGKQSPMSEIEFVQVIAPIQEKQFSEQCKKNLKQAESFIAENAKKKGVISLEMGKVQYLITEEGNGAIVLPSSSPFILYTTKTLDGFLSFSNKPIKEPVCMDKIIPGLKAGLVGMKEGEKRTIYVHPDLAYGIRERFAPNSLFIFEVEILKADTALCLEHVVN